MHRLLVPCGHPLPQCAQPGTGSLRLIKNVAQGIKTIGIEPQQTMVKLHVDCPLPCTRHHKPGARRAQSHSGTIDKREGIARKTKPDADFRRHRKGTLDQPCGRWPRTASSSENANFFMVGHGKSC